VRLWSGWCASTRYKVKKVFAALGEVKSLKNERNLVGDKRFELLTSSV
jgi:hypothetical protein